MKKTIFTVLSAVLLGAALLSAALFGACSFEAAIPKYSGRKDAPPEIQAARSISPEELRLEFSEPVTVVSLSFDIELTVEETAVLGTEVSIRFAESLSIGQRVTADIVVQNAAGSTLEAIVPFTAFNNRVPEMLINEVRSEASAPRLEFIEFKTTTAGNLAGIRLFAASNGIEMPIYEFPPVEVAADEYVVLHIRSPDYINTVDELGDDLSLSTSDDPKAQADCPRDARDLWVPSNKELLRKSDGVFLRDQRDTIIDAVMFYDKKKETDKWKNNPGSNMQKALALFEEAGAWAGTLTGQPEDLAALFDNQSSATNTLCRKESEPDTNSIADWYLCGSSKASPGKPNK
jgi:hypothetical protein